MVRSLALGAGLIAGGLRFLARRVDRKTSLGWFNQLAKRTIDVVGSAAGILLLSPLLAPIAIAIKLDSPGPVFFLQERVGSNGRPFMMVKLRTMVDGANSIPLAEEQVAPDSILLPKRPDDPRVTRVGRMLRRWSVDELPQLWNVLRGEMSLVGPRPEETAVVEKYEDWHRQRLAVKPGITGPMQVNGRAELDLDERVALEVDYITDYTLLKDVTILMRTIGVVISGKGAY